MSPMMEHFKRIACYNIAINIVYNLLCVIFYNLQNSSDPHQDFAFAFSLLGLLLGHAAVLFIIAIIYFIRGQGQKGLNYLLTMGVVLSWGGCTCFGMASVK
jgi:hypothetical protein